VDLRLSNAQATVEEREAIDALLGPPASGWDGGARDVGRDGHVAFGGHAAREQRHLLLPALHALQSRIGWISEGGMMYLCSRLTVPPADAWAVATFYGLLATSERPRRALHVCDDIACRMLGAKAVVAALPHDEGGGWHPSPCLGLCDQAPAVLLTEAGPEPVERLVGGITPEEALAALRTGALPGRPHPRIPQQGDPSLRLLRRVGVVDPRDIAAYQRSGGFAALRRAREIGPAQVIQEVIESKLMGRGGAAFPTGRKWAAVSGQPEKTRYLICNADESEPGTFKDRVLMEEDPFAIVEAMAIAAFAVGAQRGYVYIRGEYPLALERIQHAIDETQRAGWLSAVTFEVRKGAGAYICGEETAIFNSIEGFRGEPRNKPPFPVESGLFRKPTVVNNVETLANIPAIVLEGGKAFDRHCGFHGAQAVLPVWRGGTAGRLRGSLRGYPRRPARPGGHPWGPSGSSDPAGWRGRGLRPGQRAEHPPDIRGRPGRGCDPGLGGDHGLRRPGRPRGHPAPAGGLFSRRVVRAVRSLPGGYG
jgi:NADH-quinone oxidoreductase subunit F